MSSRTISLKQVRVAEPCPMSWHTMDGDDQRRFCAHCNRHVHNLSAIPEDEAQRLICESAGRLCIAYVPNVTGGVTPLAYAQAKRPRYGWKLVAALGGFGGIASGVLAALFRTATPAPPPMVAGMMPPPPMVTPATPTTDGVPGPGAP